MAAKSKADVIPLFRRSPTLEVAAEIAVGGKLVPDVADEAAIHPAAVDLSGRAKALMVVGSGNVGKTTLLRWVVETMLRLESRAVIAAVDPVNRSLKDYFAGVEEPPGFSPAVVTKWLEDFLHFVMENKASAAIDFGGGDTSLGQLVATIPDLVAILEAAEVSPVLIYVLSPRVDDLAVLATLEGAGFSPQATAIVLNEGMADPTLPPSIAFAPILRHSVYKAAVARGAVPIWMPRLFCAAEVELRRIQFGQARDGIIPEGRTMLPLGAFDRSKVGHWLRAMDSRFEPIKSWLP